MRRILAVVVFVLPVVAGLLVTRQLIAQAPAPARVEAVQAGLAVRVAPVAPAPLVPEARGWGNVRAADSWTAVSEVRGRVIWRHPDLEPGRGIDRDAEILRIDPADYQLAIAQAEADLAALRAEEAQLGAEEENTRRVLALEEARLALVDADAARTRELVAQGTAAPSRGDEAERAVLAARRTVVELQNALALLPPRHERTAAQIARTGAALERARRDLQHTSITVPFDMRVTSAPAQLHQVVAVGQTLAAGEGFARAEVVAQIPVEAFQRMLTGLDLEGGIMEAMQSDLGARIGVEIEPVNNPGQVWQGRISRLEPALEARARTVQVVIEVADPYAGAHPPERIPLVTNLQAEVRLTGPALSDVIAIPASAVHNGQVYLVGDGDRLVLRPVTVAFRQGDLAVIGAGLEPGDRLVLDDIAPAVPGLSLLPVAP